MATEGPCKGMERPMRIVQDPNLPAWLKGAVGVDDNFFLLLFQSSRTLPCPAGGCHLTRLAATPCTWDVL